MNLKTPIGRLRLLAILEGISYLLFFVTVPLKYAFDIILPNYIVGMAHGVFFLLYIVLSIFSSLIYRWGWRISLIVLVCSLIPFGTFYADNRILKPTEDRQ
jgi:integral membrane protein